MAEAYYGAFTSSEELLNSYNPPASLYQATGASNIPFQCSTDEQPQYGECVM